MTRNSSFCQTLQLLSATFLGLAWGATGAEIETDGDAETLVEEIVVTGVRGALSRGLNLKRESASVVDGISSEDIVDFPDLNVSEALQRVTGVTINRVLGEGQRVSVRGLAPEFTRVTINGQTVTSGNAGREVDFDVFASELFTNVTLTKSPAASLIGGWIGGNHRPSYSTTFRLQSRRSNRRVFRAGLLQRPPRSLGSSYFSIAEPHQRGRNGGRSRFSVLF